MITFEEFCKIGKYIDKAHNCVNVLMETESTNPTQKAWLEAIETHLSDLNDYIVDEIKIKDTP